MEIKRVKGVLKIKLSGDCRIHRIEEFHKKLLSVLGKGRVSRIEVFTAGISDFDTSFFQTLVSLKRSGVMLSFPEGLGALTEMSELYGIKLA